MSNADPAVPAEPLEGDSGILDTILSVHRRRQTALIEIESSQGVKHLHFFDGDLFLPRSTRPLTKQIADLLSSDAPSVEDLDSLYGLMADSILSWDVRSLRIVEASAARRRDLIGPMSTIRLLAEATARHGAGEALVGLFGGPQTKLVAALSDLPANRPVGAEAAALLFLLQEPMTVADILRKPGADRQEKLKALARLWAAGLLRVDGQTEHEQSETDRSHRPATVAAPGEPEAEAVEIWGGHFGLARDPFSLTPDPAFLFLSDSHSEALAGLNLGLLERRGLTVLTGEVGTGKTTLLYSLLSAENPQLETAYIFNTSLDFEEILQSALRDFGVPISGRSRLDLLQSLNQFLADSADQGKTVALVIDEAQNLSDEVFEQLRLLLNFETFESKLLQIVLVGQPELGARLREPQLRQIADRISVRCHLAPLSTKESAQYIQHRLEAAGATSELFSRGARRLVIREARGIPRRINVLCHNSMLFAFGRGRRKVNGRLMAETIRKAKDRGRSFRTFARMLLGRHRWLVGGVVMAVSLLILALASRPNPGAAADDAGASANALPRPAPATSAGQGGPGEVLEVVSSPRLPPATARTSTNLNLRRGPALSEEIVRTLPNGTRIRIVENGSEWLRVEVADSGEEGWVFARWVESPPEPGPPASQESGVTASQRSASQPREGLS